MAKCASCWSARTKRLGVEYDGSAHVWEFGREEDPKHRSIQTPIHPITKSPIPRFGSHDEDKLISIANSKLRPLLPPLDNASMMSWGSLSSFGGSETRPRPPSRVPTPENLCQYGRYQVLKRRGHSDGYDVTYSADHEAPGIARMLTTPQGRAATPMEKSGWADDPVWLCEVT